MNSIEKEISNFVNKSERFSGMDSYDSAEGESYFDDFNSADGGDDFNYASGSQTSAVQSDPYILQYENTGTTTATAILYGFNDYGTVTNGGNPAQIVITNLQGGTYGRALAQSQNKPFKTGEWRFECSLTQQLKQTVSINHVEANGNTTIKPWSLATAKDSYQFQPDILDIRKQIIIDGNTYFTFPLLAGAILTISIYPIEVLSQKAVLNGGAQRNFATAKPLSGKNVAPVIIQTSQGVKGISGM